MIGRLLRFCSCLKSPEGESGQAMVELVISMPLLLLILLGGIEFGRLDYTAIEVSNAARAAAQYAAMNGGATADTGGITQAAQNDSLNLGTAVTSTLVSNSCACSNAETTVVACNSACANGRMLDTVTVTTSATYTPLFHLPGNIPGSFTLHGYAKQMVLQ